MISLELLKTFCGTDENRAILHHPSSQDEFTYATDARVIVQVPRMAEVPQVEGFPKCDSVMAEWKQEGHWRNIVVAEIPPVEEKECDTCNGTGDHDCGCGTPHPCGDCEGSGKDYPLQTVKIGGAWLNCIFVRKMLALPNLEFNYTGKPTEARSFRFDGGIGLIMPMKG
jgi:hypothetical protein